MLRDRSHIPPVFACLVAAACSLALAPEDTQKEVTRTLTGWGECVDPEGDCTFKLGGDGEKLTLVVPGRPHLLSAEIHQMNAPRVLRDVKGDFEVRMRVLGTGNPGKVATSEYAPYHGAGILVWQDGDNYVRLERATGMRDGKPFAYANFELRQDGHLAVTTGQEIVDLSSYLRLERRGNSIRAAYSRDGVRWTPLPPMTAKLSGPLKVGVTAINSASKALRVELDGFKVTAASRTPAEQVPAAERRSGKGS